MRPDEQRRRDHAEAGVLPAHERLDAPDAVVVQRDQRLVEHEELVVGHGGGQGRRQREPGGLGLVAARVVDGPAPAPLGLRGVERDVGGTHELRGGGLGHRLLDDADARARDELLAHQAERGLEHGEDAVGQVDEAVDAVGVLDEHDELVAAGAGHELALPRARREAPGDLLEHDVADVVPETVVDRLEAVEVEEADPHPLGGGRAGLGEHPLEALGEPGTVGQRGQRIVVRLVLEVLLEAVALADVLQHRHLVRGLAPLVAHQRERQVDDDLPAVGAVEPLLHAEVVELAPHHELVALPHRRGVVGVHLLDDRALGELLGGVAEHRAQRGVDVDDAALHVAQADPDRGLVEHRAESGLTRVQGLLGVVAGREHRATDGLLLVERAVAQGGRVAGGQRPREGVRGRVHPRSVQRGQSLAQQQHRALDRGGPREVG
jgi:hypothetical protein